MVRGGGGSAIIKLPVFLERRTELLIRLAAGLAFLTGMPTGPVSGQPQALDGVVASVGSVAITRSDVEREYRLERLFEGGRGPEALPARAHFLRGPRRRFAQNPLAHEAGARGPSGTPSRGN